MDKLNTDNMEQAIIPATWDQLQAEMPEAVNALVMGALGIAPCDSQTLPIWYVLTKASGATGIPLERLYNNPVERMHALAVMGADALARQKAEAHARQIASGVAGTG